jgi:hypothetical protein
MERHLRRLAFAGTLGCAAVLGLPLRPALSQTLTYVFGISSSWGARSLVVCDRSELPRCTAGQIGSGGSFLAPTVGVALAPAPVGPWRVETGAVLAPKGWSVSEPTSHVVYVEIPWLASLGTWSGAFGVGLTGGIAVDVDVIHPRRPDLLWIAGGQWEVASRTGARFSFVLRYAKGQRVIEGFQNHTVSLLIGYTPAGRAVR